MSSPPPRPSKALRQLLESKLDTFEKLELVLLLRDATDALSIRDVARELQIGEDVLRRVAAELERSNLIEINNDTLSLTASESERAAIHEGAALYSLDRGQVIMLFSTIAMERIRGMAARAFADAFNLRKKPGGKDG